MLNFKNQFRFFLLVLIALSSQVYAQQDYLVQFGSLVANTVSKQNHLNYTIYSSENRVELFTVEGKISFRGSKAFVQYRGSIKLNQGSNLVSDNIKNVQYSYSSATVKKLFEQHGKLPNGDFSYCVYIYKPGGESLNAVAENCIYSENTDMFILNLVSPDDKAKLKELNPLFNWMVNSSIVSDLTYKLRVVEIKEGQKAANAIMRNRPVYEESGIRSFSQVYPFTAKSLEYFQPYAWTVDAYYRDVHMGSAETWQFVIIDDSLMAGIPKDVPYLDFELEKGGNKVFAVGELKLKYYLKEHSFETFKIALFDEKNTAVWNSELKCVTGDNWFALDFKTRPKLKHLKRYQLNLKNEFGKEFKVLFQYVNPDFL